MRGLQFRKMLNKDTKKIKTHIEEEIISHGSNFRKCQSTMKIILAKEMQRKTKIINNMQQ